MYKYFLLFFLLFNIGISNATVMTNNTRKYVSLRSAEVNLRSGPSIDYPILYTYKAGNFPVEVMGEYENWYKVRDKDGDEGWINKNLTTKKRHIITINNEQILYVKNSTKSKPIYILEKNVIGKLDKCIDKEWCKVEIEGKKGWIQREDIWGDA